jgi:hypothetical protein
VGNFPEFASIYNLGVFQFSGRCSQTSNTRARGSHAHGKLNAPKSLFFSRHTPDHVECGTVTISLPSESRRVSQRSSHFNQQSSIHPSQIHIASHNVKLVWSFLELYDVLVFIKLRMLLAACNTGEASSYPPCFCFFVSTFNILFRHYHDTFLIHY